MREYMQAFFDSPETIRNKSKEFKTSTFSGFNKQDVMNYLSLIAEQQSIMIGLLREHSIPLYVDDGYQQEEQFSKPIVENSDFISQYMSDNGSETLTQLQAELDKVRIENETLKASIASQDDEPSTPSFDSAFGLDSDSKSSSNNSNEIEELKRFIEEQQLEIQTLQEEISNATGQGTSDFNFNTLVDEDNSDFEEQRQSYERQISELKEKLIEVNEELNVAKSDTDNSFDAFGDNSNNNASNSEELENLMIQIESLNEELEVLRTENEILKETTDTNPMMSQDNVNDFNDFDANNKEIYELKSQVEFLTGQISNLKYENDDLRQSLEVQQVALIAAEEKAESQNTSSNFNSFDTSFHSEDIDVLKVTIEQLEKNVLKVEREKQNLELRLEEINGQLNFSRGSNAEDPVIVMDPETLALKHREILEKENDILIEKNNIEAKLQEINNKLALISEKEALIENNKDLLSEDYVNSVKAKESEIEKLKKQMDKMLVVAQTTADETEKEAQDRSDKLVDEAKNTANTIIDEAVSKKNKLEEEANRLLSDAEENKFKTEEELEAFKLETKNQAEQILLEAQEKANSVVENANGEAECTKKTAEEEANRIMSDVEERLAEKEQTILDKQSEIEKLHKYFLKQKTECIIDLKKILNKVEAIVYEEEQV